MKQKYKKIKIGCEQAHLIHFCYLIRLVLHQHLNLYVAYRLIG